MLRINIHTHQYLGGNDPAPTLSQSNIITPLYIYIYIKGIYIYMFANLVENNARRI